jgi:Tol biopolymer transport system component
MRRLTATATLAATMMFAPAALAAGGALGFDSSSGGGPQTIYTVPSTGGTPTMIAQGGLPSFSPNGKSLAYIGNGSVFVAAASNGSGVRRIASGIPTTDALSPGGPAAWSQSSKQLAYSDGSSVWVVNATGAGSAHKVKGATNGFVTSATHPVWSHDGKTLYYLAINQAVSVQSSVYQLYAVPAAGGKATAVGAGFADGWAIRPFSLSMSPSGRTLAVTLGVFGDETSTSTAVGLVPVKGGMGVALPNLSAAAFSPSGLQLCAQSESGLVTASLGGTTIDVIVPAGATGDPVACAWTF